MEKVYKAMKVSGGGAIAIGIVVMVIGVAAGVISILIGSNLLKKKSRITF